MKKISLLVATVLLFSIGFSKISHAEEKDTLDNGAGIVPGSVFYKVDRTIEEIILSFTKGTDKKAKLIEKFNEERVAESKILIEENKIDQVEKLIEEISANQDKLLKLIQKIDDAEKFNLTEGTSKIIEELEKIKSQVSAEIKQKFEELIAKQKEKENLLAVKKEIKNSIHTAKDEIEKLEEKIATMEKEGQDTKELSAKLEEWKNTLAALEKKYDLLNTEAKPDSNKDDDDDIDDSEDEDDDDIDDSEDEDDDDIDDSEDEDDDDIDDSEDDNTDDDDDNDSTDDTDDDDDDDIEEDD